MIITIDGPAGSGKSTIAAELAKKLKFIHLNSGLLYRAIAIAARDNSIDFDDNSAISELAKAARFDFNLDPRDFRTLITLNFPCFKDYNLSPEVLYSEESSNLASLVATKGPVREVLSNVQRELGKQENLVLEGRDAGSVVFPDADFKFYLDATLDERVKRRTEQNLSTLGTSRGKDGSDDAAFQEKYNEIKAAISERDARDSSRELAPTVVPLGATVVETDGMGISEVLSLILSKMEQ